MAGKEYSKGDSRYAARHSGVVSIEGVTAVLEGPACLLTLYVHYYIMQENTISQLYVYNVLISSTSIWIILTWYFNFARFAIATKKSYRYVIQLAISLGQLYGTIIYFLTSYLEGDNFATNMLYYYAYYVFANSFWVVIPTAISIHCWKKICAAIQEQEQKKSKTR